MRPPLTMLAGLPLIELPKDVVVFPGCELRLPLLPEMRGAIGLALAETDQRLILVPPGRDVGVEAEIYAISAEPDNEVTFRPTSRFRRSTGLRLPELEVDAQNPQVAEVTKLARAFLGACEVRGWFDAGDSPTSLLDATACFGSLPTAVRLQVLEAMSWDARVEALMPLLRQAKTQRRGHPRAKRGAEVLEGLAPVEMAAQVASRMEAAGMRGATLQSARSRLDLLVSRCSERDSGSAAILAYACALPWETRTVPKVDIAEARRILDRGHLGASSAKRRILEEIAIRSYARQQGKGDLAGPIICLVGPPGIGKTTLAKLIAQAMGRSFSVVHLSGVSEVHSLVGTPSAYRRSSPGSILQAVKDAGFDGVVLLDEIEKMASGGEHGDPAMALLPLLDPEQNGSWKDSYLDLATPMQNVVWIATANSLEGIPAPLKDRLEVIHLPGYSQAERLDIARFVLLPSVLDSYGVTPGELCVQEEALHVLATREKEDGVRQLKRGIESLVRMAIVRMMEGGSPVVVDARLADEWLERPSPTRMPIGFRFSPVHSKNTYSLTSGAES